VPPKLPETYISGSTDVVKCICLLQRNITVFNL
jgi:hypothetical protein